jgi:exonuclease III
MERMRSRRLNVDELELTSEMDEIIVGHLNALYFMNKMNDLKSDVMTAILRNVSVMCFTETYLNPDHNIDDFVLKHDYKAFRRDIPCTRDHEGQHGVMICAKSNLNPKELNLATVPGIETKMVVIERETSRMIVCVVYRPPSQSKKTFAEQFEELLIILPTNIPTIICGDFNDNVESNETSIIEKMMKHFGYMQHVTSPTTDHGTIIDHLYYNQNPPRIEINIRDIYFSNHDATFFKTAWN